MNTSPSTYVLSVGDRMSRGSSNALRLKYLYGPVSSWRLGRSLGIDLLSQKEKICTYDCLYCQLGKTRSFADTRLLWTPERSILKELTSLPEDLMIDYLTISGRGEPTLAANLGATINLLRRVRKEPIAVITNSSLMYRSNVREELSNADFVLAKLDACTQESFAVINQPFPPRDFETVLNGIKEFRQYFSGRFALQIMFIPQNVSYAAEMATIAAEIGPGEVQINTPLRPCGVEPIGREELFRIKKLFGPKAISVYESGKKHIKPISDEDTLKRRGKV